MEPTSCGAGVDGGTRRNLSEELFRILAYMDTQDPRVVLERLEAWFLGQARTIRGALDIVEAAQRDAAERTARLEAWRRSLGPTLDERNREIMRLARLGHGDDEIGRAAKVNLSGRQVRRIIRAELKRWRR